MRRASPVLPLLVVLSACVLLGPGASAARAQLFGGRFRRPAARAYAYPARPAAPARGYVVRNGYVYARPAAPAYYYAAPAPRYYYAYPAAPAYAAPASAAAANPSPNWTDDMPTLIRESL